MAGWSSSVARRAHNPKVVGSNPAPATTSRRTLVVRRIFLRKMRLHRSGCRSSPQKVSLRLHCSLASALTTFRLATNFLRIFPTFPQPGTGRARRPACSFFSSLLPPDPYLTHTVFPWVWVKLWSGYRRIPAPWNFSHGTLCPKTPSIFLAASRWAVVVT